MARVLGLDLGSYSVKAVLLETAMRGFAVKQFAEAVLPAEGERIDRLKAAIAVLAEKGITQADTISVALPGSSLATHPIALPWADPKKIDAALPGVVEEQLPYELEEAVFDYQMGSSDEKGANLIVGVVKKGELGPLLATLKESKVDPRFVSHSGLVYQSLLGTLPAPAAEDGAVAIIDLGHERVSLAIGRAQGTVEIARTFPGGGLGLTKALAKEFNLSLVDAQTWKEQHGAVGSAVVGADAERAAGAFIRALQPVLREVRPLLKSYTAKTRRQVTQVLICGGTAKLNGLAEQLERDLAIPTRLLELNPDAAAVIGPTPQAVQAYALALRGNATGAKAPRFNLRRGELAFKSDFDFVKERTGQLIALGVVLLVLLVASGIVRNAVLERREKEIDALLCKTTERVLGKCERDYQRAVSMMKGQESPAAGIPTISAASLLAELTQRVPAEMKVTFDQLVVDLDRVSVRCETDGAKSMEDLMAALKTYKCFKEVKEGKVEKSKDGTKVNFRLDIQVECPEDAPQGG